MAMATVQLVLCPASTPLLIVSHICFMICLRGSVYGASSILNSLLIRSSCTSSRFSGRGVRILVNLSWGDVRCLSSSWKTAASMLLNDSLRGDVTLCVTVVGGAVSADRGIACLEAAFFFSRLAFFNESLINSMCRSGPASLFRRASKRTWFCRIPSL